MPNHITNEVEIKDLGSAVLADVHARILNDKRHVDFNSIVQMPDCLKDFEPDSQIVNIAYEILEVPCSGNSLIAMLESANRMRDFAAYESLPDDRKSLVKRCLDNHQKCGYVYWYDFCNDQWETKWNAYSQPDGGWPEDANLFRFETAWSHPKELIKLLSKQLPNVTFLVKYADEDTGSNCGQYTIKNGEYSNVDIAPNWKDQNEDQRRHFTKFAFMLCHPDTDPRSYGYGEDWKYSDEVYEAYEKEQKH